MSPEERQKTIYDHLTHRGACTYEELAEKLEVSCMTVRRDVDKMAAKGKVIKTIGGVQNSTAPSEFYEYDLKSRLSKNIKEKQAIAKRALDYIQKAKTIFLDGSTTCIELAKLLGSTTENLTIITNSLITCRELGRNKNNTIVLIGGRYDPQSYCFTGTDSENQVKQFYVDKVFVSTRGFLPQEGTYEALIGLFRIKQIMASRSDEVILLVDHSKFNQRALCKVFDISQIHTVITDSQAPQESIKMLEKAGRTILVASMETSDMEV